MISKGPSPPSHSPIKGLSLGCQRLNNVLTSQASKMRFEAAMSATSHLRPLNPLAIWGDSPNIILWDIYSGVYIQCS